MVFVDETNTHAAGTRESSIVNGWCGQLPLRKCKWTRMYDHAHQARDCTQLVVARCDDLASFHPKACIGVECASSVGSMHVHLIRIVQFSFDHVHARMVWSFHSFQNLPRSHRTSLSNLLPPLFLSPFLSWVRRHLLKTHTRLQ